MQTQTHALIGASLFGRRDPGLLSAAAIGGALPDLPMFVIVAVLLGQGQSGQHIFGEAYFQPWWQHINGTAHSLILWPIGMTLAFAMRRQRPDARAPRLAFAFAGGGLAHAVIDLLCHREDAHMHFWPLSTWKFVSPVSYYEADHFGVPVMIFEALIGIAMAGRLIGIAQRRWSRALIVVAALPYLATLTMVTMNVFSTRQTPAHRTEAS